MQTCLSLVAVYILRQCPTTHGITPYSVTAQFGTPGVYVYLCLTRFPLLQLAQEHGSNSILVFFTWWPLLPVLVLHTQGTQIRGSG